MIDFTIPIGDVLSFDFAVQIIQRSPRLRSLQVRIRDEVYMIYDIILFEKHF